MLTLLKKLLGIGPKADLGALIQEGATIIDVRTTGEYASGHINGSVNIPLDILPKQLDKIDRNKLVITCCASGMRSGIARKLLLSNGYTNVHNGGSWLRVKSYL